MRIIPACENLGNPVFLLFDTSLSYFDIEPTKRIFLPPGKLFYILLFLFYILSVAPELQKLVLIFCRELIFLIIPSFPKVIGPPYYFRLI